MTSKMQLPYLDPPTPCQCGMSNYQLPENGQEWHLECPECSSILFCYTPMEHQRVFHQDPSKFRMYAGGFGSAKTSTCAAEIIDHALNTPNGATLIGAATLPQLEQTAQKTFFEMLPTRLIKSYSKQKNILILINGHTIIFRPLDDEGKARSLNLTAFWIEEASEVKFEYFTQLQTRLRNQATDHHLGILSTNPDLGWIKTEFLLKAKHITGGDYDYTTFQDTLEINDTFSVHIAETNKNIYLPSTYYRDTAQGKPDWWVRRFLHGSFENREGLVYPNHEEHIVDPFEIPKHWERFMGADFGLQDPTVGLFGAIDPKTGVVYIYDEHYENQKSVKHHSEQFRKRLDKVPAGLLRFVVGDPSGQAKRLGDMRSLFDHYAEYGIYFQPGTNKIEDGIFKVYTFFDLGILKIFSSCKKTVWELQNYKYPEKSLDDDKITDKPLDKNNHAMDSLKYAIAELPDDPQQLINQSIGYYDVRKQIVQDQLPHALQEEETFNTVEDYYHYY